MRKLDIRPWILLLSFFVPIAVWGDTPTVGLTKEFSTTLSVDTSGPYASGDLVANKVEFDDVVRGETFSGKIQTVLITDKAKQNAALTVIFFEADPSNTTFTKNSAFDINSTDLTNVICTVALPAASYVSLSTSSVVMATNVGCSFNLEFVNSKNIYAAIITTGTPSYGGSSQVAMRITVVQD